VERDDEIVKENIFDVVRGTMKAQRETAREKGSEQKFIVYFECVRV
jgi:hypothetical protein